MNTFPITPNDIRDIADEQNVCTADILRSYVEYPSDDAYDDVTCAIDISQFLIDLTYDVPMYEMLSRFTSFLYTPADEQNYPVIDAASSDCTCETLTHIRDTLFPL